MAPIRRSRRGAAQLDNIDARGALLMYAWPQQLHAQAALAHHAAQRRVAVHRHLHQFHVSERQKIALEAIVGNLEARESAVGGCERRRNQAAESVATQLELP